MAFVDVTNKKTKEIKKDLSDIRRIFGNGHLKSSGGKTYIILKTKNEKK